MEEIKILWTDDEIDLLKPYIIYLHEKGYHVTTANNGEDALSLIKEKDFDLVFLDENMPGLSGLETLSRIKEYKQTLPVVMITKSEEEHIMEGAIGSKIEDYLIKPVNPTQILLTIKKIMEKDRLVNEQTSSNYRQEFRDISMRLNDNLTHEEWASLYKKLIYWELELEKSTDESMYQVLTEQKIEANRQFCRFFEKNYISWLQQPAEAPLQSHTLFKNKVLPFVDESNDPVFFILIDNLRFDQWKIIEPIVSEYFKVNDESTFYSILPTATQYARNAIFAGLMPSEIEKRMPNWWLNDEDEGGKNQHEQDFLADQLSRNKKEYKFSYTKVTNTEAGRNLVNDVHTLFGNKLNVIVYNFVDMLSHARTEMEIIRELATDESAYRSITRSWFEHSPLLEAMKKIAEKKAKVIITTDHGTVKVNTPVKIVGDKNTNTNLRYKQGKSLNYDRKDVFEIKKPEDAKLPKLHVSSAYVFARSRDFFAYPNNYNYYVTYYKDTFQHGGISLEEVIIPYITLTSK